MHQHVTHRRRRGRKDAIDPSRGIDTLRKSADDEEISRALNQREVN